MVFCRSSALSASAVASLALESVSVESEVADAFSVFVVGVRITDFAPAIDLEVSGLACAFLSVPGFSFSTLLAFIADQVLSGLSADAFESILHPFRSGWASRVDLAPSVFQI